jgi:hypothetical protein
MDLSLQRQSGQIGPGFLRKANPHDDFKTGLNRLALADFVAIESLQKPNDWDQRPHGFVLDSTSSCGWLAVNDILAVEKMRATLTINQEQVLDIDEDANGSFLILGTYVDVAKRPDYWYGGERFQRVTLVTCLGLFVTPVGEIDELVFERRGAGQISWKYAEKQFEEEDRKPSLHRLVANQKVRAEDESAPGPRSATTVTVLETDEGELGDQRLEHGKPLPHAAEETATPYHNCIKRRLFCMKEDIASMNRHFLDERLTTITLV